jgi:hypothetical protein
VISVSRISLTPGFTTVSIKALPCTDAEPFNPQNDAGLPSRARHEQCLTREVTLKPHPRRQQCHATMSEIFTNRLKSMAGFAQKMNFKPNSPIRPL